MSFLFGKKRSSLASGILSSAIQISNPTGSKASSAQKSETSIDQPREGTVAAAQNSTPKSSSAITSLQQLFSDQEEDQDSETDARPAARTLSGPGSENNDDVKVSGKLSEGDVIAADVFSRISPPALSNGDLEYAAAEDLKEYEVENIIDDRNVFGVTEYLIKWAGYPSSANTWERESNLTGSGELLSAYWQQKRSTGNRPHTSKKRKLTALAEARQSKKRAETSTSRKTRSKVATSSPPPVESVVGVWDDKILIDGVEYKGSQLWYIVLWKDSNTYKSYTPDIIHSKAPQRCIQFLESNLRLTTDS
ncbi:uncharacterized protein V1516DRAFT_661723 [Lipomyces oligophaga]|uniref:uncharacterized protein n=1 Tax=Lipomyces oligophaga TaxID=45792 RepID=UPI0034CD82C5